MGCFVCFVPPPPVVTQCCCFSSISQQKEQSGGEEELAEMGKGDGMKFILSGLFGCVFIAYVISVASQMPADPNRMTQEKQKNMTMEELKAYEGIF